METRAHYVAVGAFVLAVIVIGFMAVLSLGRVEFAQDLKRYYIFFKGSVTGLSKGSIVQYNGITVGRVIDVRVDPDDLAKIQVTVEIDKDLVPIKTDARAFVDTNLLSGVATIQIRGGTRDAKDLEPEPNHRYPVIAAGQSELEQLRANLPELLGDLREVAQNVNAVLDEQNRKAISDSLQNVRTVTENFVAPSKEVSEVVENANATVLALKSFFRDVDQSFVGKGGLRDQLSLTLNDADKLAKNLGDTNRQLQQVLQENRPGLHEFTQSTLTQVSNLVGDMQHFIAGLSRFVSSVERDPARLLFGERREGYKPQ
jgi:phospholipid/cholesterol/gamma-HCH transport system substrate-binding protein